MMRRVVQLLSPARLVLSLTLVVPCLAVAQSESQSWQSVFADGLSDWNKPASHWGKENIRYFEEPGVVGNVLRVTVHQGGIDPATMRRRGLPVSGTGFLAPVVPGGSTSATLSYRVRFPVDFPFMRGGKLPGLYGGKGNGGGRIPDGTDGFSFRLMWLQNGLGRVYAYLPSSITYGTPIFEGKFSFRAGQWHRVTEEVTMNQPGLSNGAVRLWLDGVLVGEKTDLMIRTIDNLKIDGIFFDYFFGGNDDSWAAPKPTYTDFAEFRVRWK
jgi:hypothetical protein